MRGRAFTQFAIPCLLFALGIVLVRVISPARIVVDWETASEIDTTGFLLYRARDAEGPFSLITEIPVPARGDPLVGAAYQYEDRQVAWGQRYFYQLEEIDRDGNRTPLPQVVAARAGAGWPGALVVGALLGCLATWWVWRGVRHRP